MVSVALSPNIDRPLSSSGEARGDESASWDSRSDLALAATLASGDAAALDRLYAHYRPVAFSIAYSLLADAGAAEDVVQDAFIRAWRNASSFQATRGSFRAWLLTIVRNTAIDQLRARKTAVRHQTRLAQFATTTDGDDVSTSVIAQEEARRLRAALGSLPLAQRHAVELAFFAGLSHGEIAALTGIPLGTVKGRMRLGLRRLRHDLRDLAPNRPSTTSPESACGGNDPAPFHDPYDRAKDKEQMVLGMRRA
jgi:RNA polymerase sigma factor (sigma-70 family)